MHANIPLSKSCAFRFSSSVFFQVRLLRAAEKPILGLIPKAQKPIPMDGKLTGWDGAFVTPVHVGHPDFANRGGQFLYLWDEKNLYVGMRCLDRSRHTSDRTTRSGTATRSSSTSTPAGRPTRRGGVRPRHAAHVLHPLHEDRGEATVRRPGSARVQGVQAAGSRGRRCQDVLGVHRRVQAARGRTSRLHAKAGEVIGIECELCSSDGGPRVDRTFVYSGAGLRSARPAAFGRVQLVDKIDAGTLKPLGRALLPLSLTRSTNYAWLYGTVCVSPTIEDRSPSWRGKLLDAAGKCAKTSTGSKKTMDGGFTLWTGSWELFDLPPGVYTLELVATDKAGGVITSRTEKVLHGKLAARKRNPVAGFARIQRCRGRL